MTCFRTAFLLALLLHHIFLTTTTTTTTTSALAMQNAARSCKIGKKASYTTFNIHHHLNRLTNQLVPKLRNRYYDYNSFSGRRTGSLRMALSTTNLDVTGMVLCPKCRGEGAISRAPSKKSRLRHQRLQLIQHDQQQKHTDNDNDHKRVKLSSTAAEINNAKKNDESRQQPLTMLPRRWHACKNCDSTGLLISPTCIGTISSTENNNAPFVAIIGGGIGGMALAVALRHRRIPFHIFEKDSRLDQRSQGYGLTLQQARRALRALGIVEHDECNDGSIDYRSSESGKLLQQHAVTSKLHVVHTPDGSVCGEWGLRKWVGGKDNRNTNKETNTSKSENGNSINPRSSSSKNKKRRQNLHVPRQTLRQALYEALKEASVVPSNSTSSNVSKIDNNDVIPNISWGHNLVDIKLVGDSNITELETNQQSPISSTTQQQPKVQLSFQVIDKNGHNKGIVTSQACLVVGCDGIRSSIRNKFLRVETNDDDKVKYNEKYNNDDDGDQSLSESVSSIEGNAIVKPVTPLRYLNCIVILGICPLGDLFEQETTNSHTRQQQMQKQIQLSPLLDGETVFQTADGTTRIYLMPYSKKNNEYMWQLSFPIPDEEIAIILSRRGPEALKEEALRRCQLWHSPIPEILRATPIELVSGYPVYDRDLLTSEVLSSSRRRKIQRPPIIQNTDEHERSINGTSASTSSTSTFVPITLLGDAAHPMSPFKGQGANQALLDALSLARSLYRVHCREGRSLIDALELYEKEMINRSSTKVQASSEAAKFLHTEIAIQEGDVTRGAAFSSSLTK